MTTILSLIGFSVLIAVILAAVRPKANKIRGTITLSSSIIIAAVSILLSVWYLSSKQVVMFFSAEKVVNLFSVDVSGEFLNEIFSYSMLGIEVIIGLVIIYLSIKYRKYLAGVLAIVQIVLGVYFEFNIGHEIAPEANFYIDKFSLIMILIIGIIGTLICIYAVPYMKDHAAHLEKGEKDRRGLFFFLLFIFLGAMFGIVVSNNLQFMLFFWEVTTFCSFMLIGYTKTKEAINNSFRAINMNLLGGLTFIIALIICGTGLQGDEGLVQIIELDKLIEIAKTAAGSDPRVNLVIALLAFAGITKAAQIPFSKWLLGAMVAPTPTSALLHSSTMVKAGVFLIIKLSPALGINGLMDLTSPGFLVTMIGGVTFLIASFQAVSQSNAKRVLAYSTIANLGLIITCAGIGTDEAVFAAILLTIFHAVTKSLLFLLVGTAEHNIGSRDIEDFDGLFSKHPRLAVYMIIGIAAMYLAPFGMLLSKWIALEQFAVSGTPLLLLILAFGSAVTLFYWTKWLGKMIAVVSNMDNEDKKVNKGEYAVHTILVCLVALVVISLPFASKYFVAPYIKMTFSSDVSFPLGMESLIVMIAMVIIILVIPLLFYGRTKKKITGIYLAGVSKGDDLTYKGSMQKDYKFSLRNWYMDKTFNENKMQMIGYVATFIVIGFVFLYCIGGIITMDQADTIYKNMIEGLGGAS